MSTSQLNVSGDVLAAVSNELSRLKAHHYGRGPDESKSYINDEFLFCVMKGGLTRVEQTLISAGDESLVRQVRLRFQEQMHAVFTDAVEKLVGRRVLTYQSQLLVDPDCAIEMFVLGDPVEDG